MEVRATKTFARNLKFILKKRRGFEDFIISKAAELADNPENGKIIPGTNDLLRKKRIADPVSGKGKRGGLRLIYAWKNGWDFIVLCMIYPKSEKSDATHEELELALQEIESNLRRSE